MRNEKVMSEENQSENPDVDIEIDTNQGEIVVDNPHGNIEQIDLQTEMQRSYLDYAMAVMHYRMCETV